MWEGKGTNRKLRQSLFARLTVRNKKIKIKKKGRGQKKLTKK